MGWAARDGAAFAGRIAGAEYCVIENAGHLPQLQQPTRFVELVLRFSQYQCQVSAWPRSPGIIQVDHVRY